MEKPVAGPEGGEMGVDEVHGIVRKVSGLRAKKLALWLGADARALHFHTCDLADSASVRRVVAAVLPDEIYNLGSQSNVGLSHREPERTFDITATAVIRILEAVRAYCPKAKFYQASSSEMFGRVTESPQRETTPFRPNSPYAMAKVAAHQLCVLYRENYGMFIVNGILFNHESPRRDEAFVTRKITRTLAEIKFGLAKQLVLGNLDARRDWGYAPDYVEAMWKMLQQQSPQDLIIATGKTHTVREFVTLAALQVGFRLQWKGNGVHEVGIDAATDKILVSVSKEFFRPVDTASTVGDARKARRVLRWKPRVDFTELVELMVDADIAAVGSISATSKRK